MLYKVWGYCNKFYNEIIGAILLICQNAKVRVCGAWIRIYYVLCSKRYSTLGGRFWTPTGSRWAAYIYETSLLTHLSLLPDMCISKHGWHCLFSTKPLPEPMLNYCRSDPQEQTSEKFKFKSQHFHSWKCIWKHRVKWHPFYPGGDEGRWIPQQWSR